NRAASGKARRGQGLFRRKGGIPPPLQQLVRHAELVADAADDEIDSILQRLRPRVEGGHGGQNYSAGFGAGGQVSQLDQVQRRFARHEDKFAPFFQMHFGSAVDQVL